MLKTLSRTAAILLTAGAGLAIAEEKGPFGGFKHDSKEPIEITSDTLEVRQAEELAIFTGDVIAGQGTLRLTADKLDVYYTEQEEGDAEAAAEPAPEGESAADTGAIERLVATGNVFLSNGTETAQGQTGTYDVKTGMVTMDGNVVLTQGGNAISGQQLEIDLNTGVGKVFGGGQSGSRVKSIFTPASQDKDN
ncbi:lipopolysaccharide transport periplasmic protein LptA [Rhodobacteraceae bacterium NNCM2]|nr:lipopolysaccharide transport periplasmic protein LptA [Coraliihabitans acroporae]